MAEKRIVRLNPRHSAGESPAYLHGSTPPVEKDVELALVVLKTSGSLDVLGQLIFSFELNGQKIVGLKSSLPEAPFAQYLTTSVNGMLDQAEFERLKHSFLTGVIIHGEDANLKAVSAGARHFQDVIFSSANSEHAMTGIKLFFELKEVKNENGALDKFFQ